MPPKRRRRQRNFSVEKYRSANCPAINGAETAPNDAAIPIIHPTWPEVNPSPPSTIGDWRYVAKTGNQTPQTAYCKNIIRLKRLFTEVMILK
tara:strand:+ start:223 stop:498 length:276 start_codon:yes stop_codon:yes gene_type:complete